MSNSFDNFMQLILSNGPNENIVADDYKLNLLSQKELSKEFRKVLDKISIEFIYDRFESEKYIQAIISLSRAERIIIVFHVILGMTMEETSFLLDAQIENIYSYKSKAIRKLKTYIEKNDLL